MIGKTLGHYRIIEAIGSGGMGDVYLAADEKLDRKVALKLLPPEMASTERRQRFEREAKAVAALNHPNIVTLYSVEEADGVHFLTMELVRGRTLRELIPANGMALAKFLELAIPLTDAVAAAHEQGITHRDLKPANIMESDDGLVKVLDFGLAKPRHESDAPGSELPTVHKTQEGQVLGTVAYMSPEQARGEDVDARSDLFSLGAVLYELVTGQQPFGGSSPAIVFEAILNRTPAPASERNPDVPPELDRILEKALEKDRDLRYQSAADLRADLKRLLRALASGTTGVASASVAVSSRPNKHVLAVTLVFAVAALVVGWFWRSGEEPAVNRTLATPVQLTANPIENTVVGTGISPDGKYLAYADITGLYLRLMETGETRPADLPEGFRAWSVDWYPDGTRLLLTGFSEGSKVPALWAVSILGGTPRKLHDGGWWGTISPDGAHIAFTRAESPTGRPYRQIWVMGADGQDPRMLVDGSAREGFRRLAWSPDSKRILYGRQGRVGRDPSIESRSIEGEQTTVLISDPRLRQGFTGSLPFVWSSDGRLLYARAEPGAQRASSNIWAIEADLDTGETTGEPRRLTQLSNVNIRRLSLTSSGKRLVSLQVRRQMDVYVGELDAGGIRLKSEKRLTFDERSDGSPSFSHDSGAVLFRSDRSGTQDIFKRSIDAGSAEAIVAAPGDQDWPISSPDGTWFLYRIRSSGDMMRVPASGGPSERVLTMAAGGYYSQFRCIAPPVATCILGERDVDANEYVFSAFDPLEGRGEELLRIEDRPPFTGWDLSRDGRQVAVVHNDDNRIRIVTLATGEERVLTVKEWRGFESIAWAPNGTSFYVNGGLAQGVTYPVLLHVDPDGNTEVLRQKPNEWHFGPAVSPDGRYLAFTTTPFHGNVWMIEDF